ncbi:MAG: hypothetical protein PHQ40_19930 [Anaerolineaceae bacterium]|nr:hypothetical protein [Anaerolineaceae bacterium]
MNIIKVARLHPEALLPTRKHPADAGLDLYVLGPAAVDPHSCQVLPTGITVEISEGYFGLLKPKGKNDHLLGAGVVDAGYQGEILVKVVNPYDHPLVFPAGAAIAQLLVLPIVTPLVQEVDPASLHATASRRGSSGGIHESPPN